MSNQGRQPMQWYYVWPNQNLRAHFELMKDGNLDEKPVTTPFAEGEDDEHLLGEWLKELSRLEREWPTLYDYEVEMQSKVGPLSCMKPLKERMDSITAYYEIATDAEPLNETALSQCIRKWMTIGGLRRRSKAATIDAMRLSTNSGAPFYTKRRLVVESEFNAANDVTSSEWRAYYQNLGRYVMCATLGWRGREGGPSVTDTKQRVLWMFPMQVNIAELSYYQPVIIAAQRANLVPAWNGDAYVDQAMTELLHGKPEHELVVCTDFSAYDAHFGPVCQDAALLVLQKLFQNDKDLQDVLRFKYNIPLCIGVGKFMTGRHGMASGSGGTNVDETIFHTGLQLEAAVEHNSQLNPASMCLGDDGVLSYPGITPEQVVESYTKHGLEMNIDKQYVSEADTIYLRRWHHRDYMVGGVCVGVYPTMRALGRLRYMERYIDPSKWGKVAVAMRELSVIENCRYHPLFQRFVEFCVKRDKYRLGLDIPGFMAGIDDVYMKAKANDTLYVSYSQEFNNPSPPSQWSVVQVLKTLRK
nr:RNA-dependent RNA polymerase [Marmot picobirnavirus]